MDNHSLFVVLFHGAYCDTALHKGTWPLK